MSVTRSPNTVTNWPSALPGSRLWNNPANAKVSDDSRSDILLFFFEEISRYILAIDFSFVVTEGEVLTGIELNLERFCSGGEIEDHTVSLVKDSALIGDNKKAAGTWGLTETVVTYGGPSDLWGTSLTVEDVTTISFGCVIAVTHNGNPVTIDQPDIDHIELVVYSEPVIALPPRGRVDRVFEPRPFIPW